MSALKRSTPVSSNHGDNEMSSKTPAAKKSRTSLNDPKQATLSFTAKTSGDLLAMDHKDLVDYVISLQKELQNMMATPAATGPPTDDYWTPAKVTEKARKLHSVCNSAIVKQMKWQPSCKQGTTRWSYTGTVPHEDVFFRAFGFQMDGKAWKQKKMTPTEFQHQIGEVSASIRYGYLQLTSKNVTVTWDKEEMSFKLSGTYGLPKEE